MANQLEVRTPASFPTENPTNAATLVEFPG